MFGIAAPFSCCLSKTVVVVVVLWTAALAGCGTSKAASKPAASKPAPASNGYVFVPRAPDRPAAAEAAKATTLGPPVQFAGEIRRHPQAGTKMEMITGRYHLYVGSEALWLEPSVTVSEDDFDAVAAKQVHATLRKREEPADTSNPDNVQRPSDGLPARTVYVVVALAPVK